MFTLSDKNVLEIINRLEENGFSAYAVGGCVRDLLIGREVNDYDVATSALPSQTKEVFRDKKVIETGIKHGTVTVLYGGEPYEVTTYRTESAYSDSRHPDSVTFVDDIESDLARRDFTVNAMAYSPKRGSRDPFGGASDAVNKIIRAVGNAYERFDEDALRILRALRFASALGFTIEPGTSKAIFDLKHKLKDISAERVYSELTKLVTGPYAAEVISAYRTVIEVFAPVCSCERLDLLPPVPAMRFAYLFGAGSAEVLRSLRSDNATASAAGLLANSRAIPADRIGIKRFAAEYGRESAVMIASYRRAVFGEDPGREVESVAGSDECLSLKELAVKGRDLKKIGITGRRVGETLDILLSRVIDELIPNEKERLIRAAEEINS